MVVWMDAYSHDAWETIAGLEPKFSITESVGFLIRNEKAGLVVAGTRDVEGDNFACTMVIPHGMIQEVYIVRTGEKYGSYNKRKTRVRKNNSSAKA